MTDKLTLEQIDEFERTAVLIHEDNGLHVGKGHLEALCQLARERLQAGTFQQGIEVVGQSEI